MKEQHVASAFYSFSSCNGEIGLTHNQQVPHAGKGVFTTIKIKRAVPLFLPEHIARLRQGIAGLGLEPQDFTSLETDIEAVLEKNRVINAAIRVTVIGNTRLIHARPIPIAGPISVITAADTRTRQQKEFKVIDRSFLELIMEKAESTGASDVLLTDSRGLIESTVCNIFSVNEKGQIITPPVRGRGLNGISENTFMRYIPVTEEEIPIGTKGPLILTNSLRLSRITAVNGIVIADGINLLAALQSVRVQAEQEYIHTGK
jgi:branched-subunit amino acid aminotransferase/4-amino-4-deoxychorismate lyase